MSIDHPDHAPYRHLTKRQRVDTAVYTLTGFLRGISIDDELNASEIAELLNWCNDYRELVDRPPFSELIPKLDEALSDGQIDPEEIEDLLWVCKNLSPEGDFYNAITHEIQILHGMLHGILADGHVSLEEAAQLHRWVDEHEFLKGTYPYDELDSLLMTVLADNKIDEEEQETLRKFFEDFVNYSMSKKVRDEGERIKSGLSKETALPAICSACPEIEFSAKSFVFTGASKRAKRKELADLVIQKGGSFDRSLTQATNYLVVGADGNPCWAFSCYGRKVQKAVDYRKQGHPIVIVHESDFWDAVEDHGG